MLWAEHRAVTVRDVRLKPTPAWLPVDVLARLRFNSLFHSRHTTITPLLLLQQQARRRDIAATLTIVVESRQDEQACVPVGW